MSNLESAKAAIEAEIAHAMDGLAYYQSRVESLESALKQLTSLGIDSTVNSGVAPASKGKRGRKPGTRLSKPVVPAKIAEKAKTVKTSNGGKDLPFTGGTYWQDLVTTQPQSATEILKAAIAHFGFTPTKDQIKKMVNRQTFALNSLVKAKVIQDSGKGRERRFFKAQSFLRGK